MRSERGVWLEGIAVVYALIGIPELLLIVAIVFLFFGGSKLPGLARAKMRSYL